MVAAFTGMGWLQRCSRLHGLSCQWYSGRTGMKQPCKLWGYLQSCHSVKCYTEKATPARHRPKRQHNTRPNRRKQCSPMSCHSVRQVDPLGVEETTVAIPYSLAQGGLLE